MIPTDRSIKKTCRRFSLLQVFFFENFLRVSECRRHLDIWRRCIRHSRKVLSFRHFYINGEGENRPFFLGRRKICQCYHARRCRRSASRNLRRIRCIRRVCGFCGRRLTCFLLQLSALSTASLDTSSTKRLFTAWFICFT